MPEWKKPFQQIEIGTGRVITNGEEIAILTIGHPGNFAVNACKELKKEGFEPAHFDMRFVKPLDEELLHSVVAKFDKIITVEDGCLEGGFGSAVLEFLADNKYNHVQVRRLGIPNRFIEHGSQQELWQECEYDAAAIMDAVREMSNSTVSVL